MNMVNVSFNLCPTVYFSCVIWCGLLSNQASINTVDQQLKIAQDATLKLTDLTSCAPINQVCDVLMWFVWSYQV